MSGGRWNLWIKKFRTKCETVSHKLTWSHYFELLKCDDKMEFQFYFHEAEKEGWKVRELKRQMKSSLF